MQPRHWRGLLFLVVRSPEWLTIRRGTRISPRHWSACRVGGVVSRRSCKPAEWIGCARSIARRGVTQADEEAMRNKGGGRTPEKRELLRRTEARAKAAGL